MTSKLWSMEGRLGQLERHRSTELEEISTRLKLDGPSSKQVEELDQRLKSLEAKFQEQLGVDKREELEDVLERVNQLEAQTVNGIEDVCNKWKVKEPRRD
eukprot:gb/GECG01004012.1/.p1 GENE.gb/GECG01004012.1/~~gb/GECG01004012.1/.p1  ORF type:complete len:100 (+),score=21.78 gb/GECG01004012.1/:1-300(+)